LESEYIAALTLGFLLAVPGLVVLGEVVADDALLAGALADLPLALGTHANEAAPRSSTGTQGVGCSLLIQSLLSLASTAWVR
jgi:hypothetical protein